MDEYPDNSNQKTSINLSRNMPVALVVGAAGFLGSAIVDKLLKKNIQVIGVDNLSTGIRQNLTEANKARNFHLIIENAANLSLDVSRIDYIVITAGEDWDITNVLTILKNTSARCLFISSIDLYDQRLESEQLKWLRSAESKIAKFAQENNLNARVLRLGAVFGPRMQFRVKDPIVKLARQALEENLQKEVTLDFSSRALFIDDASELAVKSIFAGSTAQRIFDGVLPDPIKVSEIKQILMDPLWYESKKFTPSQLPPWPTPNLEKTIKFLSWHPKTNIVRALRETLSYFKDNEIKISQRSEIEEKQPKGDWKEEERTALKELKKTEQEPKKEIDRVKKRGLPKFKFPRQKFYLIIVLVLIIYSLIWPIMSIGWGVLTFRYQLLAAVENIEKGEFDKSLASLNQAEYGLEGAKDVFVSLEPLRRSNILTSTFELGDNLSNLATYSVSAAKATVLGVEELYKGLKSVTGESTSSPKEHFEIANVQLTQADEQISKAYALINTKEFQNNLPKSLKSRVDSLETRLSIYRNMIKNGRAISVLLPELIGLEGPKNYLILLQNNNELRPTGGFIGSFAKVTFEGGKLKKLEVNDIYAIDGQLPLQVEPPKEIREDLGQSRWYLRDSNWEPDFPTAARQAQWFFVRETQEQVEGVLALDISAIENLLEVVGPLDLPDYSEKITADNLFEKAVTYAEVSFFPGSQGKKNFLTALSNQLFNKLFFLPNQNWPGIVSALGRSLEEKHMSVYLDDSRLFSYLVSQGWTNALPRPGNKEEGFVHDFLAPVEANLGANKSNYYLDRSYNLETVIGKEGQIRHRLRVNYVNKSPSDTFPAGKYKNRMRIYVPFGSKLIRVVWGESDITRAVESFVDYGRSGFSFLIELEPKEAKNLVLDFEVPEILEFVNGLSTYRLDVIKQAGTLKDPFEWSLSYPINYSLSSEQGKQLSPQEQIISTDLSRDRSFEVVFKK